MEILQMKNKLIPKTNTHNIKNYQSPEKSSIHAKPTHLNNNNEIIHYAPVRHDSANTSTKYSSTNTFFLNTHKNLHNASSSRVSQHASSTSINTVLFADSISTPLDSNRNNSIIVPTAKNYNDPCKSLLDSSFHNIHSSLLLNKRGSIEMIDRNDSNLMINSSFKITGSHNVSNINLIASKPRWSSVGRYNFLDNKNSFHESILVEIPKTISKINSHSRTRSTIIIASYDINKNKNYDEERYKKGSESISDPNNIIGSYYESKKPKDFIQKNAEKFIKIEKIKPYMQFDHDDVHQSSLDTMSPNNVVNNYYGDGKPNEFTNRQSTHKIDRLTELQSKRFSSNIFPRMPNGYVNPKNKIENGKNVNIMHENANNTNSSGKKMPNPKNDPKKRYRRMTLAEFNAVPRKESVALPYYEMDESMDDECKSKISDIFFCNFKNFLETKKIQDGDFLNFPVLELGKQKFGGTISKDVKLDARAAHELLESFKPQTMNE